MSDDTKLDHSELVRLGKLADAVDQLRDNGSMARLYMDRHDGDLAIVVEANPVHLRDIMERACTQLEGQIAQMIGALTMKIACEEMGSIAALAPKIVQNINGDDSEDVRS